LEEFENKIEKISSGQDDNSWLGQLYSQMSTSLLDNPGDGNEGASEATNSNMQMGSLDGLEPPMFDETWDPAGSGVNGAVLASESNYSSNEVSPKLEEGPFKDVVENVIPGLVYGDDDNDGAAKCQKKFMTCAGGVLVNGGLQHMNQPDGISGAVRKMLFKVAFHGGLGNFWNALMTVPEARGIKRCMNVRDECVSKELLSEELRRSGVDADEASRILINPDFAQATDNSDGSEMFSPEDQKLEEKLTKEE